MFVHLAEVHRANSNRRVQSTCVALLASNTLTAPRQNVLDTCSCVDEGVWGTHDDSTVSTMGSGMMRGLMSVVMHVSAGKNGYPPY